MWDFYKGRRVFVTGHNGFKGSWLCMMLHMAGAEVTGYALPPEGEWNLFSIAGISELVHTVYGDIRDGQALKRAFDTARPEIVFHLAAQPIVREGYRDPVGTYHTNVMGTVNLLDCVRGSDCVRSVLNVTTDKVYENRNSRAAFVESDRLDGFDPYANSKSCAELVTACYRRSFLDAQGVAVSTARAGNVIGGGDFAKDRIIPDCVRAAIAGNVIQIRNPNSVRPYQYVLDALSAYLLIAEKQYADPSLAGPYNVGPEEADYVTTGRLADMFCAAWGAGLRWERVENAGPHEDCALRLSCDRLGQKLRWKNKLCLTSAIADTVKWTKAWQSGKEVKAATQRNIFTHWEAAND